MNQLYLFEDSQVSLPKNFVIYRSSAGSGKTFTLVKEYLKIVLRNPKDYQHILAITFTNKATEEMKERILDALMDMAAGKDTDMKRVIEEEVKHFPQKLNIQDRAQKALSNILHDYSRFSVSTIDHFFSQLVRALARELKLSLNYEIDVDDDTAMEEAIELLYESLTGDRELRDWTKDFAFNRIEDDKGWQLDYTLLDFGKELFKEKFHQGFSKISKDEVNIASLRELEKLLANTQYQYSAHQKQLAKKALDLITEAGLRIDDFKGKSRGAANTFNKILRNNLVLTSTFQKTVRGEDDWYSASSLKRDEIKSLLDQGLSQLASEIYQYHLSNYQAYMTSKQLRKHIYSYGLLDAISEQLKVYRQSNNLMLLSHNSFLLREIISDKEAPFLFEKLGSYYHHVLIDEFQDTSTYQWENVKPLITNSLDGQNHVLLVGDVKQSIYRWRGGDLNLLLTKAVQDLSLYSDQLEEKTLQINRRSAQQVVAFNNQFFSLASQFLLQTKHLPEHSMMLSEVYKEVAQESHATTEGGVSIKFFERNQGQWVNDALDYATQIIKDHISKGGDYNDFLILCDRNVEVAQVSQHLSMLGIPVDSEQALKLSSYWAVRLLVSSMYLLVDPQDSLARAEMAYLYQTGAKKSRIDFHSLFSAALDGHGPLEEYLPKDLVEGWEQIMHKNIYEWVSSLISWMIPMDLPDPFLARFLEVCLEQNIKGNTTAQDFLNWWEEHKEEQMVIFPSHQQAVRVMTIHKAKGLEAPIVLLPWADFELKPNKDSLFWTDKLSSQYAKYKLLPLSFTSDLMDSHFAQAYQQELLEGLTEGLNTVYVAFTRARQRLYVCSVRPRSKVERDDLGRLYKLLWEICNQPVWEQRFDPQSGEFVMGDLDQPFNNERPNTVPSVPVQHLRVQPYEDKVGIQSGSARMFTLLDHYKAQHIREGLQLHAVLERLINKEDLPVIMNRMQAEGMMKHSDKEEIAKKLEQLFKVPGFTALFDQKGEVFAERALASQGKRYQPDRVVVTDDMTMVVDYKREKEADKHKQQVATYASLLSQMGYQNLRKILVYIEESRIVEV